MCSSEKQKEHIKWTIKKSICSYVYIDRWLSALLQALHGVIGPLKTYKSSIVKFQPATVHVLGYNCNNPSNCPAD